METPRAPPSFPVCPGSLPVRAGAGGQLAGRGAGGLGPLLPVTAGTTARAAGFHLRVCRCQGGGPGAGNRGSCLSEFSRVSPRLPPPNSGPGRRHSQGWGAAGDPAGPRRERGVNPWAGEWQGGRGLPAWPLCPQPLPCPRACLGNGGVRERGGREAGQEGALALGPWLRLGHRGSEMLPRGGVWPLRYH